MGFMTNYTPTGETLNLSNIEFELAVDRLVSRALQETNARYQALLKADSAYQAFLAGADKARASAKKYRQISEAFIQKAEEYKRRLDGGLPSEETDYRTEIEYALMHAHFYRQMTEKEEEKTFASPELRTELENMRERAFNSTAEQFRYNTWKNVGREASAIEGEIMADIYHRLDNAARGIPEERAAEERRVAMEANRPYLDGARGLAEKFLRDLFGEHIYAGEPEVGHVDGRFDYKIPFSIYTDNPEATKEGLPKELRMPEGGLTLQPAEIIPLNDGSGTFIVQATYTGSKSLHK